jgi:hypothetical protein
MKISRAEQAGAELGKTILEMVNLMYQKNTAKNFRIGLAGALPSRVGERQNEIHEENIKRIEKEKVRMKIKS